MNDFDTTIQTFLTHITFGPLMNHAIRVIAGNVQGLRAHSRAVLAVVPARPEPRAAARAGRRDDRERARRARVRLLAQVLPFRVRPIYNPDLHLHFPSAGLRAATLQAWSSFPSDHAMLWMAIATGIFIIARRVGVFALLYAVVFICVPRAYLGFHYPTDLIAGAAIGIALAWLTRDAIRSRFAPQVLAMISASPRPPTLSCCASS